VLGFPRKSSLSSDSELPLLPPNGHFRGGSASFGDAGVPLLLQRQTEGLRAKDAEIQRLQLKLKGAHDLMEAEQKV